MAEPRPYLLFTLAGPMASFGDVTVGEIRSTWERPSKSAVLGLVAAALGVPRSDEASHATLHATLGFAVRPDQQTDQQNEHPRLAVRDYHTAQAPTAKKGLRWATRRDELADELALNTILSTRWYWSPFAATVALWARAPQAPALADIAAALARPAYALYLGRKACPLGQPPAPLLLDAPSLVDAFSGYDSSPLWPEKCIAHGAHIWADADHAEADVEVRDTRRDTVVSRKGWLFEDRVEHRIAMPGKGEA